MPVVSVDKLASLQRHSDDIRNICILAHVDHGKTSLIDALLATNGIISPKLAGKIRYLDSRPDEQQRGITMESSAISLYFSMMRRSASDAQPEAKEYLINLIDSPGHIDFSSEVSTASRLCDGACVLVDAVEGVCSQTVTVLRQSWVEKIKSLLVINKIDRLITELKMTPTEANAHLTKILEQVNAVLGSFFQGERMEEDLNWREKIDARIAATTQTETEFTAEFQEKDDSDIYFAPEKNNVIFSSAIDGWAFTVRQFAHIYEKKLGLNSRALEKVLWGNYYLDPKTKKILSHKHLKGRNLKPLFVQLVLEPIWTVYAATTGGDHGKGDPALLEKITKSLNINFPNHILRSKDPRVLLTSVFSNWLPISVAMLVSVVESLPSPRVAQAERLPVLLEDSPGSESISPAVKEAMVNFRSDKEEPVVIYVSKVVSVPKSELPENKRKPGTMTSEEARELARRKRAEFARKQAVEGSDDMTLITEALENVDLDSFNAELEENPVNPELLIGFARIYSGTVSVGDKLYVILPKWSPSQNHAAEKLEEIEVKALYMLMGRQLETLQSVPAGCVFGIGGLDGKILKSGTLCSVSEGAPNLAGVNMTGQPIVRVALEPTNPQDLDKMVEGLKLLVQSDPCAEYEHFETGEHVLLTAGELHLERCLTDLQGRFARCEIQAGAPIVPYRETIVRTSDMRPPVNKELGRGKVVLPTSSKQAELITRVVPLPAEVTAYLKKNINSIKKLYSDKKETSGEYEDTDKAYVNTRCLSTDELKEGLRKVLEEGKGKDLFKGLIDKIASFGPHRVGPNLLIDATPDQILPHIFVLSAAPALDDELRASYFRDKIAYAFQLATNQGPLCNEPTEGVAIFVEKINIILPEGESTSTRDKLGRLTGEVIKTFQAAFRAGFLDWSPRIMLAMYSVEIQAATEVLGRVYDVLTRRRGRVIAESMNEGTPFFTIQAVIPVAESFEFADETRKRTSGAAQPQLIFAGFEILNEDPFWVPHTEDDLEDLGELADKDNVAKRYMDGVRKRKGLLVEGRNVATDAEKQKTLKR